MSALRCAGCPYSDEARNVEHKHYDRINRNAGASQDALKAIADRVSDMQMLVLSAICLEGPIADGALAILPQFRKWAPSTARSRRAELQRAGFVKQVSMDTNERGRKVGVYDLTPAGEALYRQNYGVLPARRCQQLDLLAV